MGSVVMAEFGRPVVAKEAKGERVADNKRTGFVLMYRSLLSVPFKRMPERFSLWVHLVLEASYDCDDVQFNGNRLRRYRGQIVGSVAQLAEACGISEDCARRSLDWFEREGMIERTTRRGARGYTVITITSYDDYQRGITETYSAGLPADFKPASGLVLQADCNELPADLGADLPAEALNNTTNQTISDPDLGSVGSEDADATSTPANEPDQPIEYSIPDGAAIHARSGKTLLWGTADDLQCAQWFCATRARAFTQRGLNEPKAPSMVRWANDIRLMREHDGRGHREICELFAFVCRAGRELEFCQSPDKLRSQWDALQLKRANAEQGVTSRGKPMSNLAAAQQRAQALKSAGVVSYGDDTPL